MKGKGSQSGRKVAEKKLDVLKDALEGKEKASGSIIRAFKKLMHQEPDQPPGKGPGGKK